MNVRAKTTPLQDAHLLFLGAFEFALLHLTEDEHDVLLDLVTTKVSRMHAEKVGRDHRNGDL